MDDLLHFTGKGGPPACQPPGAYGDWRVTTARSRVTCDACRATFMLSAGSQPVSAASPDDVPCVHCRSFRHHHDKGGRCPLPMGGYPRGDGTDGVTVTFYQPAVCSYVGRCNSARCPVHGEPAMPNATYMLTEHVA